jgi:hypothetical protein
VRDVVEGEEAKAESDEREDSERDRDAGELVK